MIPFEKNSNSTRTKYLLTTQDVIDFVSNICHLYINVDVEFLINTLSENYLNIIQNFVDIPESNEPLIVCFNCKTNDSESNNIYTFYDVQVLFGLNDLSHVDGDCIGFYKSYTKFKLSSNNSNECQILSENKTDNYFILLHVFFNKLFPLKSSLPSYLNDLLIPICNYEDTITNSNNLSESKYNQVFEKLNEISGLIEHIDIGLSIDDVKIEMCGTLKSMVNPVTKILDNYQIIIEDELVLDDIKSNVRGWSSEIIRIIREYLSKFSGDYDEDDNISSSESSSEYDSEATSGSSTSPEQKYLDEMKSDSIDLLEEIRFWSSYKQVLSNLIEKVKSPNFVNTLLLLEYNDISVNDIYCFDESVKLMDQIGIELNKINLFFSEIKLSDFLDVNKLSDIDSILDNVFSNTRKYHDIKYIKNERFGLLFKGMTLHLIFTLSRIISFEIRNSNFEDNNNILIKTVEIVCNLKSKIINLERYFHKNKISDVSFDNKLLIILDLYIDVLQGFCKCNNKFLNLNDDINSIVSYLKEDIDLDEQSTSSENLNKIAKFYNEMDMIICDINKSYHSFVSNLSLQYKRMSEQDLNIEELDGIIVNTNCEMSKYINHIFNSMNIYLEDLDLFEVLPIIKIINSFKYSKLRVMFVNLIDKNVDCVVDEYDRIVDDMNNNPYQAYYNPLIKVTNNLFSRIINNERIQNLDCVVKELMALSPKLVLKTIQDKLESLLMDTFDYSFDDEHEEIMDQIVEYKHKYVSYKMPIDLYKKLLRYDIFVPTKDVYNVINKIRDFCFESSDNFEMEDVINTVEKIYTEYINSIVGKPYSEKSLINLIDKILFEEDSKTKNISSFLRAYNENKTEFQNFFESEINNNKVNDYFNRLSEEWCDMVVEFDVKTIEFNTISEIKCIKLYSVSNINCLSSFIDDNITKLNVIKSSNYETSVNENLNLWINKFYNAKIFFQDFDIFNKKFNKLVSVLSSKVLDLKECVDKFCKLCDDFDVSNISKISYIDNTYISLIASMIISVEEIELMLNKYLNNIRHMCPRLYFIQDSDLINIIGNNNIEPYMSKIFPGINSIINSNEYITGVISNNEEEIIFEKHIEYNTNENIKFINDVDLSIKDSLKKSFELTLNELSLMYSKFEFDDELFNIWIEKYSVQMLVLSLFLCWTQSMESSEILGIINKLSYFISKMIEKVILNLCDNEDFEKIKEYQLFLVLNYQVNKTNEIINDSSNLLKWTKCIKYYYNKGVVQMKIMNKTYLYSFEYMFNIQKMIITSVTEHFYTYVSMALKCNLLPSIQGPAGTGKTETIKSLSYLTGSNMLVFNFGELYELDDIEKILSGLCMMGYWGIFDEFNRLNECVLSSIAETIRNICDRRNKSVILLGTDIDINQNVSCFITMNPGYQGRNELPINCVHMCQPFVMEDVDLISIIQVNLQINGFKDYLILSNEIIFMLKSLKLIFTSNKFDFGLRFVKYIFNQIGLYKGDSNKDIFVQCLYTVLNPRLTDEEVKLYNSIICTTDRLIYSNDELDILKSLRDLNISDYIISKSFQIYQMSLISSSIILYGQPNSGKSYAFNKFIEYMRLTCETDVITLDPNSLTINQLYGCKVDDKWIEGLIPQLIKSHTNGITFIVFDGEMRQEWVENLNSLLDDNKILTLSNGERIPLGDNIKIIFETSSLDYITPATVSRNCVIQFENKINNCIEDNIEEDEELMIKSMIDQNKSFLIQYQQGTGVTAYFKNLVEDCLIYVVYLSNGLDSSNFIEYLISLCDLNSNENFLESKSNSKSVVLIKDVCVLNDRNECVSLYGMFVQILKYNHIYRYDMKNSRWNKIYLKNIIFVFMQSDEFNEMCSLRSVLPCVRLSNDMMFDNKISEFLMHFEKYYSERILSHDLSLINSVMSCENGGYFILMILKYRYSDPSNKLKEFVGKYFNTSLNSDSINSNLPIKCDSIIECYIFIYLSLLYGKSFLCILGPCVSGKMYLSKIASSNIGFELVDLTNISIIELENFVVSCGMNFKQYTFFVNMDVLSQSSPNTYYIVKNMIYGEYMILIDFNKMNQIHFQYSSDISFDQFEINFNQNLKDNIRFVLIGNTMEKSILNRGIICRIYALTYNELLFISGNVITNIKNNNLIVDIYVKIKEFIGDKFIEFVFIIKMVKHWYDISSSNNNNILNHLTKGVDKIMSFKNEVNKLESSLNATKDKLEALNIKLEREAKMLNEKQIECEEKRKIAVDLTVSLKDRKSSMEAKKQKINYKIHSVAPMIEKAKEEVVNISKKSLEELKSMYNPPNIVKYTIETVSMVLQNSKRIQWDDARKLLKTSDFIQKIVSYNVESMSEQTYCTLKERLSVSHWDLSRISKASKAAGPLAKWANSILSCYQIYKQMIPLKKEIRVIEDENHENESILNKQNLLISELVNQIENNKIDYDKNVEESENIVSEMRVTETKLKSSKIIIEDLSLELIRWESKIEEIKDELECLLGNSIIESIIPIYTSLNYNKRKNYFEQCLEILNTNSCKYSLNIHKIYNLGKYVINRNKRFRHIIILDSNESEYLSLIDEPFTSVSAVDHNFLKVLDTVKSLSGNLVINDIHCCDTRILSKILDEFKYKIDNDSSFNIYLLSTNEYFNSNIVTNRQIKTSIYNRGLVLNMKLNSESFKNFAKNKIVEVIDQETYSLYVNSNKGIFEINQKMKVNGNKLLDRLIESDIFDPGFIQFIQDYKKTTNELDYELKTLRSSDSRFQESVENKIELVELLCEIYNEIIKLEELNNLYYFDFYILFYFTKLLYDTDLYLTNIIVASYNWIEQGLFKKDKLYWGISMLDLLSKNNNQLNLSLNSIEDLYCFKSHNTIEQLIISYLKSNKYHDMINDYYDTVILLSDGFQNPFNIAKLESENVNKMLDVYSVSSVSELNKVKDLMRNSLELGNYLILENIHLSKTWINTIETEFVNKHKGTKMFLTCDKKVELSRNMILSCHKITCELGTLKEFITHLFNLFKSIPNSIPNFGLILLKCIFVHSVIFVRQLYIPYGWSKNYNFNLNDIKMAVATLVDIYSNINNVNYDDQNQNFSNESDNHNDNNNNDDHDCNNQNSVNNVLKLNEIDEILVEVYSAKISNSIDLKILDDIIKVSNKRIKTEDNDFNSWIINNPMDDELTVVGFTKYTQNEIFKSKIIDKSTKIEYDTKDVNPNYNISCDCKIFQFFVREEVRELRSKPRSLINPQKHKKTCELLCDFIQGQNGVLIDLNNILSPNRLIDLLRLSISRRINIDSSKMELRVTIDHKFPPENEIQSLNNECYFIINAVLYNGVYIKDTNSIVAGDGDPETHNLRFTWIPRIKDIYEIDSHLIYIPLYNSNGFVRNIINNYVEN